MIDKKIVDLFARDNKVKINVAEREIVLTYVLKVFEVNGLLDKMVFKGGTAIKKCIFGKQSRFSMDLDFTNIEEDEPDDIILGIAQIFNNAYYDISFKVNTEDFYVRRDKLSCGAQISYEHSWNKAFFDFDLSFREKPILSYNPTSLIRYNYFKQLEFKVPAINCFRLEEMLSEKIRATYQRVRARDIYDLSLYAEKPLNLDIVRSLVMLKFWNVKVIFKPEFFFEKLKTSDYDWSDLENLLPRDKRVNREKIIETCLNRYKFLSSLNANEKVLIDDAKRHKKIYLRNEIINELLGKAG